MRLMVVACLFLAQSAGPSLTFEVASIKPAPPDDGACMRHVEGGPGDPDPVHVRYTNTSLMNLLGDAYPAACRINGPAWLDEVRFDMAANVPPGTTKPQFRLMLQNFLAERFAVKVHHETKEFSGYDLVVMKGGPKLTEAAATPASPPDMKGLSTFRNGVSVVRMTAIAQPASALARIVGSTLNQPVADRTGLTGKYDFSLEYSPRSELDEPGIADAIKTLGLTLKTTKVMRDVLVVDHANNVPVEN